jgi:hypothetical protein
MRGEMLRLPRRPFRKPSPPGGGAAERRKDDALAVALGENIETIRSELAGVQELSVRFFKTRGDREGALLFLSGLVDVEQLSLHALAPLIESASGAAEIPDTHLTKVSTSDRVAEVVDALLAGKAIGLVDRWPGALVLVPDRRPQRPPKEPRREGVIVGPKEAFNESLENNIALMRSRLRTAQLKTSALLVGDVPVSAALMYLDGRAVPSLVRDVEARVRSFSIDHLDAVSALSDALDQSSWSPFPQSLVTERPDVVVMNLMEGSVAVFAEGSPSALVAPITFVKLFHSPEDHYLRPALATAVRLLRILAFVLTTTAVPAYVALVSYHYEMIPLKVLVATAQNRSGVPFTPLAEALLIDVGVELLREAGVRLPRPLGQTLSVAAALVIGQSILASQLVSPALLVAVGFTSLASFTIPDYNTFLALRLIRFPITILAGVT